MKTLTKLDLMDYVFGAVILGCGGGGEAEWGKTMIEDAFKGGYKFKLAGASEIDDGALLCILAGVGGGVNKEIEDKVAPYFLKFPETGDSRTRQLQKSAGELSEYVGKEFYAYIASETGGGNGILPMYLNALEGKPSVDADCCGRAKPEMGLSLTNVAGISVTPLVMVSPFMETVILKTSVDDCRAEDITRNVAVACGGGVTVARCPATVSDYKKGMAANQVTRCIRIGEAIRKAKGARDDPEPPFVKTSDAHRIFEGKVSSFESEGKGGFDWGDWIIEGTGSYKGHRMRVWFKNENLMGWIDENPRIVCPDLICIVESRSFEGLSNFVQSGTHNNKNVKVYGIKAFDLWRTAKGLEIFGPKHFGFDIEYRPFEI